MKQTKNHVLYGIYEENLLIYVGITNNFNQRRWSHFSPSSWKQQSSKYLYRKMNKYGKENYHMTILEESNSRETICELEKMYIAKYSSLTNLTVGGEGVHYRKDIPKVKRYNFGNKSIECYSMDLITRKIKKYDSLQSARADGLNFEKDGNGSIFKKRYVMSTTIDGLLKEEKIAIEKKNRYLPILVLDFYSLDIRETICREDLKNYSKDKFKFCQYGHYEEYLEEMSNKHFWYIYNSRDNTDIRFTKIVDIMAHLNISENIVHRAIRKNNTTKKLDGVYIYKIPFGTPVEEYSKIKSTKASKSIRKSPLGRELTDLEVKLMLEGKIAFS